MPKRSHSNVVLAVPADYAPLLAEIKARVQSARIRAGLAANRGLLALYWDIGQLILSRVRREGWGTKVIDRLSADLQREFPGRKGFSPRNLKYMRAFAKAWPENAIGQQPAAQAIHISSAAVQTPLVQSLESIPAIVQRPVAQLPWRHHTILLDRLTDAEIRLWYASQALEHGWSGDLLALQIEAGLHVRQGKAVTNFRATLPPAQSDLAQSITKDPYLFDFLLSGDEANERAVETGLVLQHRTHPLLGQQPAHRRIRPA